MLKAIQRIISLLQSLTIFRQKIDSGSQYTPKSSVHQDMNLLETLRDLRNKVSTLHDKVLTLKKKKHSKTKLLAQGAIPEIREKTKKRADSSQAESVPESLIGPGEEFCLKADKAYTGNGEPQDFEKARTLYFEASQAGSARACACLAKMYEAGIGGEKNLKEAFLMYKQGAQLCDASCMFALGKYFEKNIVPEDEPNRGIEDAVSYYERAAGEGNAEALTKLGYMHEKGIYYRKDMNNAIAHYTKAVQKGDPLAMNYLGLHYYRLIYDKETPEHLREKYKHKACELFKKSKDLGCARAANNLGMCYEQGVGVEKDLELAFECYKQAADKKYAQGMINIAYIYLQKAKANKLMENYERAAHWLRAAIIEDKNLPEANFYLGFLHEKGLGVDYDFHTSFSYYQKAALLNYPRAAKKCGDLLFKGKGLITPNVPEALKYYEKAADLGDGDAFLALAKIHENGAEGIEQNVDLAIQYYEKAKELGCADAGVHLSNIYHSGLSGRKDPEKAKMLMLEAANQGSYIARDNLISHGILPSCHNVDSKYEALSSVHEQSLDLNESHKDNSKKIAAFEVIPETKFEIEGQQTFGRSDKISTLNQSNPNTKLQGSLISTKKLQKSPTSDDVFENPPEIKVVEELYNSVKTNENAEKNQIDLIKKSSVASREKSEKLNLDDLSAQSPSIAKKVEDDIDVLPA